MNRFQLLKDFVNQTQEIQNVYKKLQKYQDSHALRRYKLVEISKKEALSLYQNIQKKFYKIHSKGPSNIWFQNELRLFIWILICYMQLKKIHIRQFNSQDWAFFTQIFYIKSPTLFNYQAKILLDYSLCLRKWSNDEDSLLIKIVTGFDKIKWNQIAKDLFSSSSGSFIRTAKQCRERWLNHLDPSKSKQPWSLPECKLLLESVILKGKKWASLVQHLKGRRSQHSIKNKYNSMVVKQKKINPLINQNKNCQVLIQRINKILEGAPTSQNDELIFGESIRVFNQLIPLNQNFQQQNSLEKSTTSLEKTIQTKSINQNENEQQFINFSDLLVNTHDNLNNSCSNETMLSKLRRRRNSKANNIQIQQQFAQNHYSENENQIIIQQMQSSLIYLNDVKLINRESELDR